MATAPTDPKKSYIIIATHGDFFFKRSDNDKGISPFAIRVRAPNLEFFRETFTKYCGMREVPEDERKRREDNGEQDVPRQEPIVKERSQINVRGLLKKKLLPMLLGPKHEGFRRVRQCIIDEIISSDGKPLDLDVRLQSRDQLAEYIRVKRLPMDVESYINIDELRTDIEEYEKDKNSYFASLERRKRIRENEKKFRELNELIGEEPEPAPAQKKGSVITGEGSGTIDL
ncbi:MAG: hypothetical protein WC551_10430 [Patescibacteria group bacterium]